MCCMGTDDEPTNTRLFNVPVTVNGKRGWRCLLYTNEMTFRTGRALMIVPVGGRSDDDVVGPREIYLTGIAGTEPLREGLQNVFYNRMHPSSLSAYDDDDEDEEDDAGFVPVIEVGDYKCSVVFSVDELLTKVDWSQFQTPADLDQRLEVLQDARLMPPNAAFVVAEAIPGKEGRGFGVVYPSRTVFFPTCHEGNATGMHDFDVTCYALARTKFQATTPLDADIEQDFTAEYRLSDGDAVFADVVAATTGVQNGVRIALNVDECKVASALTMSGVFKNQNLFSSSV